MKSVLLFALSGFLYCAVALDRNKDVTNKPTPLRPEISDTNHVSTASEARDDLKWLVGRWRCASRQYLVKVENLLDPYAEDSLDYFNVYYPYSDDRLTLNLTDNPEDRPIAAEFLVRHIAEAGRFEEQLVPMAPRSTVYIGKDRIWLRDSPIHVFEFRYRVEDRGARMWLILESRSMRLELYKLLADVGDIKDSFVLAPIRDYPTERISQLEHRYDELRKRHPGEVGRPRPK